MLSSTTLEFTSANLEEIQTTLNSECMAPQFRQQRWKSMEIVFGMTACVKFVQPLGVGTRRPLLSANDHDESDAPTSRSVRMSTNISTMTANRELLDIRKSIDNLDNALVAILAERFRLTERVGHIKLEYDLPSQDRERERAQQQHYSELATQYGLDPRALLGIMTTIIQFVKDRHEEIKANAAPVGQQPE